MKAFVLAAGLGTRLRPWTLEHPKALVPVGGTPMLERVVLRLKEQGFNRIVVNVHHFAEQIEAFLACHDFGVEIKISDERKELLDTGGALLHAAPLLCEDDEPVLVHNVDILSDAPLRELMLHHKESGASATLLTSGRESSRRLVFSADGELHGWHNLADEAWRPADFRASADMSQEAFSGIHVLSPRLLREMPSRGWTGKFSVIDYYLDMAARGERIHHYFQSELKLIDIGKSATLAQADALFE